MALFTKFYLQTILCPVMWNVILFGVMVLNIITILTPWAEYRGNVSEMSFNIELTTNFYSFLYKEAKSFSNISVLSSTNILYYSDNKEIFENKYIATTYALLCFQIIFIFSYIINILFNIFVDSIVNHYGYRKFANMSRILIQIVNMIWMLVHFVVQTILLVYWKKKCYDFLKSNYWSHNRQSLELKEGFYIFVVITVLQLVFFFYFLLTYIYHKYVQSFDDFFKYERKNNPMLMEVREVSESG